jgi:hypothetical protein
MPPATKLIRAATKPPYVFSQGSPFTCGAPSAPKTNPNTIPRITQALAITPAFQFSMLIGGFFGIYIHSFGSITGAGEKVFLGLSVGITCTPGWQVGHSAIKSVG